MAQYIRDLLPTRYPSDIERSITRHSAMTPPLRITYLADSFIPSRYANSIHVFQMCHAFSTLGTHVTLLARPGLEQSDPFEFYGVRRRFELRHFPWNRFLDRTTLPSLYGALRARNTRPDLVYCWSQYGAYFAACLGLPVIVEVHSPSAEWSHIRRWMFQRLLSSKNLNGIVVITEPLRTYYEATFQLPTGFVYVSPDGANAPTAKILPRPLGSEERLQVGYAGHLYDGRGIEIIEGLAKQCQWADFHLAGGNEDRIAYWRGRVASIENFYVHGFMPPANINGFCQGLDVLLAPFQKKVSVPGHTNTVEWMSPMKIFEYMAAGRAIICSDLPVIHEVLEHERNALLCDPSTFHEWMSALHRLQTDPALRMRLGTNAFHDVNTKYTWTIRADSILRHFGFL